MPKGIVIFEANGCGKTTLGHKVARLLQYKHMDIEDYYFAKSVNPYTAPRAREECLDLMLADMETYGSFVLTAVSGDFGDKINTMYQCAVWMSAPLALRLERIKKRSCERFGERARPGGDLYEQEQKFFDYAASRSLEPMERWAATLSCPVLRVDGAKPVTENAEWIVSKYQTLE